MTVRRIAAVVAVATLSIAVWVSPAVAAPVLEPEDAAELANKLAEATEEQDVCYGWSVTVVDDAGSGSGTDEGTYQGPGRSPFEMVCQKSVFFVARIHYTSELSESPDDATFFVESTLAGFDTSDISLLGVNEDALLGDKDDLAVFNATSLLPLLVAEQGLAPPIPVEQTTGTIPPTDRPTGGGGSDRIRTYGGLFFIAGLLVFAGVAWLVTALVLRVVQARHPDFALSDLFDD